MAPRERIIGELRRNGIGVEVGTWKGDFAARLLAQAEPKTLHLVDPWMQRNEAEFQNVRYGGQAPNGQSGLDEIYEGVLVRFAKEIEEGTVVVHRMTSDEVVAEFDDESVDWVYVDGDHHYLAVKADLEAWYPKLRPGGILGGDDFGLDDKWWGDGVTRAVREFAARSDTPDLTILQGTQFCFKKV
jgi:SAM-dependent methyltransferase